MARPYDDDSATNALLTANPASVYHAGIAAGSLTGGPALERLGAGALSWTAPPLVSAAFVTVALGRVHAFPGVPR